MNSIKSSGEGAALQVTGSARAAGLVEENEEGDATRLAKVRVHAFEGLLLAVDVEKVANEEEADLVAVAARDTGTAFRADDSQVQIAGHGYQLQLPPYEDAGFSVGDSVPCQPGPNILSISDGSGDKARLTDDLLGIRREQRQS